MKKRFLNRIQDRYLQKRFPENLVPKKAVNNSDKKIQDLLARNGQRKGKDQISASLARSINLSLQLKRGAKSLHQRRLGLNCLPSLQIDTLERGSLTFTYGKNVDPLLFSSKVWIQSENWPSRFLRKKDFYLNPLFPIGRKRKKIVSVYSSSQLEGALSRQQEKRSSAFLLQLMERKKLRILYGNLSNRETSTLILRAIRGKGRFSDILFRLLESRLDVVLCKIGFFPTIPFARQWIYHGKVLVNGKIITLANYLLQPGDVISIAQAYRHLLQNCINQRVNPLSICLSKGLKPRSQQTDKKDYSSFLASSTQAVSLTKINLSVFPWLQHLRSLESMPSTCRTVRTELQGRKQGANILSINTGGYQERGEAEHLKSAQLTLTQLVGDSVATAPCQSDKEKFRLAAWRLGQKFIRNKLRAFSLKLTHVEVSYKLLKAVYLYPSQRVVFPALIDIEKILNS